MIGGTLISTTLGDYFSSSEEKTHLVNGIE
jgi:hypothetical protein